MTTLSAHDTTRDTITRRAYRLEADFWAVRDLIIHTQPITPTGWNWDIRRWDGNHWHRDDDDLARRDWAQFAVWETANGVIVGVGHPEYGGGEVHLQLHPDYRHIEEDIIAWAEDHAARPTGDGAGRQVALGVKDYDMRRQHILRARGWERTDSWEVSRRMRFGNWPLPPVELADGYTLYTPIPDDLNDCQRIADLLNAAFRRTFHNAGELHNFMTKSPSFESELTLFAVAPDGTFAAHVGITYEPAHRYGIFEPVCTHPDHQRKGLARALINEGLHRLRARGARDAYVDTGEMEPANSLYDAAGFIEVYKGYWWKKTW